MQKTCSCVPCWSARPRWRWARQPSPERTGSAPGSSTPLSRQLARRRSRAQTLKFEATPAGIKLTSDGTDAQGSPCTADSSRSPAVHGLSLRVGSVRRELFSGRAWPRTSFGGRGQRMSRASSFAGSSFQVPTPVLSGKGCRAQRQRGRAGPPGNARAGSSAFMTSFEALWNDLSPGSFHHAPGVRAAQAGGGWLRPARRRGRIEVRGEPALPFRGSMPLRRW